VEPEHRLVPGAGVNLHIALQGEGPLVLMCHGFPGLWYSWRKQLPAIAASGFRAVALDQRGYGDSDRPVDVNAYDSDTLVADVLAVLDALGEEQAILIGQDFGAPVVWNTLVRAPDRVRAAVIMGVPFDFEAAVSAQKGSEDGPEESPAELSTTGELPPSEQYALVARDHFFHMHYFQAIGPADRELGNNPRDFLTRLYWALSAEGALLDWRDHPSEGTGYLDVLAAPSRALPWGWMSNEDMDYIVQQYSKQGPDTAFIGGLNSYRVADRNWEIARQYRGAQVAAPVLFLMGEKDPVRDMLPAAAFEHMRSGVPKLEAVHFIPDAGHFVMQEAPDRVNSLLIDFLRRQR
jgi:pimeloyl-ACP methyl ester carboxylesterase